MNKKLKIFLYLSSAVCIIVFFCYNYILHGGSRDLESEKSDFIVKSNVIISEFTSNTENANKKYLEKAVEITGKITATNDSIVTIDNIIICNLTKKNLETKPQQNVIIKGRVVGFDDLMGEIKLDNCSIIKN